MIEIVTKDGVFLDLSPDDEFEIEYESPLFADDRIPVPYSTSIAFLPTRTNCIVFGYINAMMLEPSVKAVDVEIRVSGIPLFFGSLEYDSYEDGKLNYNFAGKSVEDTLSGYIHETEGLSKADGQRSILGNAVSGDMTTVIANARDTDDLDFCAPMIVGADNISKYDCQVGGLQQEISPNVKFRNWTWNVSAPFVPAVRVKNIMSAWLPDMLIDGCLEEIYGLLGIAGLYYPDNSYWGFREDPDMKLSLHMDVADMLPECTVMDFLTNILKILCASVWNDGGRMEMLSNSAVLDSEETEDWEEKVSDVYALGTEDGEIYDFGYGNDDSENVYSDDEAGVNITTVETLQRMCSNYYIEPSTDYSPVKVLDNGNIYSWMIRDTGEYQVFMGDMLYHNLGERPDESDSKKSTYDAASDFILVKCIPISAFRSSPSVACNLCVCPIIDFPSMDGERPKDVYIGLLKENQMVDKGPVYDRATRSPSQSFSWVKMSQSLVPQDLRNGLHRTFADWIEKDRQLVSVDLNLSVMDIAGLKLWRKVYFCGRTWLIKKLTLTFAVAADSIRVSGDFVSM